jgi:hypothetical protein
LKAAPWSTAAAARRFAPTSASRGGDRRDRPHHRRGARAHRCRRRLGDAGFIDIHTHYDGQATWDETFSPSIHHGATTVVMGNCGVGFAPVRKGREGELIKLMEGVEDIPARRSPKASAGVGRAFRSSWTRSTRCRTASTSWCRCRTTRCGWR